MENRPSQISVLPVLEADGRCVGLLRLHDLYLHRMESARVGTSNWSNSAIAGGLEEVHFSPEQSKRSETD